MDYNYNFFKNLFDVAWDGFQSPYYRETQACFEKHLNPLGLWKQHPTNPKKYGHITIEGEWDPSNRINTHPNVCKYFYEECIKHNPIMFIEFENPKYYEYNAKKMWNYLDENFDLYFTKKITTTHYNHIRHLLKKSWIAGVLSTIAIIPSIKKIFKDIDGLEYTFKYGDDEDMKGIDIAVFFKNGDRKTFQIKSGSYINLRDEFLVTGAPNHLKYTTDYYGYVNIDDWTYLVQIIIFENDKNRLKKDSDEYIHIPADMVLYYKTENMEIPKLLQIIFKDCSEKKIDFNIEKEGDKNQVIYDEKEKTITFILPDIEDENLSDLLLKWKDYIRTIPS